MDLDAVKEVKAKVGGTINDVVLAIVSGAMREFLQRRGIEVDALDFRAMLPVNVRSAEQGGKLGNRVSFLMARLPSTSPTPRAALRASPR